MDYYTFQPVSMHRTIAVNLTKLQMGKIVCICENSSHRIRSRYGLGSIPGWVNAIVNELYLTAHINSLPEVPLPVFDEYATNDQRLAATLQYEWGTARIELEVLIGDTQGNWASLGETALKNSNGYRYRKHRLLDLLTDNPGFQLEEGYRLGVMLKNMGFGDLRDTDSLSVTGNWIQEFIAVQAQPPYVVNNVYGSTGTASPTPTPTPTPTTTPAFTLALQQGKTSAVANGGDSIILTFTDTTASSGALAKWYKDGINTSLTESLNFPSTSGTILISSSALAAKGAGKYKLVISYKGTEYTTSEVDVTLNPEASLTLLTTASEDTSFFVVNDNYTLSATGRYFTPATTATYQWYRNDVALSGKSGTFTVLDDGTFSLDKNATSASFLVNGTGTAGTEGAYKLRFTQGTKQIDTNTIYGAESTPSAFLSPNPLSISGGGNLTAQIYGFKLNSAITTTLIKDNVELTATAVQRTYTENGGNAFNGYFFTFSILASSLATAPYGGSGSYKLKVTKDNTPIKCTSSVINITT